MTCDQTFERLQNELPQAVEDRITNREHCKDSTDFTNVDLPFEFVCTMDADTNEEQFRQWLMFLSIFASSRCIEKDAAFSIIREKQMKDHTGTVHGNENGQLFALRFYANPTVHQ